MHEANEELQEEKQSPARKAKGKPGNIRRTGEKVEGQDDMQTFKPSIEMEKNCDENDFENGMDVGATRLVRSHLNIAFSSLANQTRDNTILLKPLLC